MMGTLVYGETLSLVIEDRTLAHLQVVIGAKLRRGESLYFTWHDDGGTGGVRTSLWLHPGMSMAYVYDDPSEVVINAQWVHLLMGEANRPHGLRVLAEPTIEPAAVLDAS